MKWSLLLLCLLVTVTFAQVDNLETEELDITDVLEQNIDSIEELLNGDLDEAEKILGFGSFLKKVGKGIVSTVKKGVDVVSDTVKAAESFAKIIKRIKDSYQSVQYKGQKKQCWHLYGNYCGGGICGNQWWDGCKGRNADGNTCHLFARPAPIDEVDKCCQTHDDCCSKLSIGAAAGKQLPCDCNKNMYTCFEKAKPTCNNVDCKVAGAVMKIMSKPLTTLKCQDSCFNIINPMNGLLDKIKTAFDALGSLGVSTEEIYFEEN
jgi:hypothetical protein